MRSRFGSLFCAAALCLLTVLVAPAEAQQAQIAEIENGGNRLVFHPAVEAQTWTLIVSGPCNFRYESQVKEGPSVFRLGEETIDGRYKFSLAATRAIAPDVFKTLRRARATGDNATIAELCRNGRLPDPTSTQSGTFTVVKEKIVYDATPETRRSSDNDEKAQAEIELSPEARDGDAVETAAGTGSSPADFQIASVTSSISAQEPASCDWARMEPDAGVGR